jgi:hypothetical protein
MASWRAKTIDLISKHEADNWLVQAQLDKQTKFDTNLIIHYTSEKRLQK